MSDEIPVVAKKDVTLSELSAQSGQYVKQQYQKVKDKYEAIPEEKKAQYKGILTRLAVVLGLLVMGFFRFMNRTISKR